MFSLRFLIVSISISVMSFAAMAQDAAVPAIASPTAAPAAAPTAGDTRPVTRAELPALVRDALMNNPEMIKEAVQKLREKQEVEAKRKTDEAMVKYKDALYSSTDNPSVGAEKPDVTLVEFFDYHCGYCRHMLPTIAQTLKEDKKARVVFVEYPILSEDSVTAARAALAVNRLAKDKYFDYHSALMKLEGAFNEKALLDAAKKLGISADKLKAEMAKPEITAILDKNREMAVSLGITGTPALVMADTVIPGAIPYDELKKSIANVRAGRKPLDEPKPEAAAPAKN